MLHVGKKGAIEGMVVACSQEVVIPGEGGVLFEALIGSVSSRILGWHWQLGFSTHIVSIEADFISKQISGGRCTARSVAAK